MTRRCVETHGSGLVRISRCHGVDVSEAGCQSLNGPRHVSRPLSASRSPDSHCAVKPFGSWTSGLLALWVVSKQHQEVYRNTSHALTYCSCVRNCDPHGVKPTKLLSIPGIFSPSSLIGTPILPKLSCLAIPQDFPVCTSYHNMLSDH